MKIILIDRLLFEKYLSEKKVTDENVEDFSDVAIIMSVNTDTDYIYFKKEKDNLIILKYDNSFLEANTSKIFSESYAKYVFDFIKKNRKKRAILLYFEKNMTGAAAIAMFIYEYLNKDYKSFIKDNPSILPDIEVYSLLHREWRKDLTANVVHNLNNKHNAEDNRKEYTMILTDKYVTNNSEKYGLNNTYFYLPLSERFNMCDIISPINKQSHPVFIIEDPVLKVEENIDGICKYWLHKVVICSSDKTLFYPKSLLLTGTIYSKIKL